MLSEKLTIKALRAQNNMKQEEVARAVGVSTATYNRYEQHPEVMTVSILVKLAKLFHVDLCDIFLPHDTN